MLKLCSRKRGKSDAFRRALIDDARQFAGVLPNRSRGIFSWVAQVEEAEPLSNVPHSQLSSPKTDPQAEIRDTLKVANLIHKIRARGHSVAQLDPLKRTKFGPWMAEGEQHVDKTEGSLSTLLGGLGKAMTPDIEAGWIGKCLRLEMPVDSSRQFHLGDRVFADQSSQQKHWTLPEVVQRLRGAYCGTLTAEFMHLGSEEEQNWIAERLESPMVISDSRKQQILHDLVVTDAFERFLASKFPHNKRFGIEGCEALLPGLRAMVKDSTRYGVEHIEIGMPHRGRLNVLCNLLQKPAGLLFSEMQQSISEFHVGDVQYHQGTSSEILFESEDDAFEGRRRVHISAPPNPSHLESINAVVQGMVRAEQDQVHQEPQKRVAGLLVHGDAAFAGLGIVAECLQMSKVTGYNTGGILHVLVNNQIGFTTSPSEGRSCQHPTDLARAFHIPIFHVNADDAEAVVRACKIAAEWRATFHRDVVVDLVGYRRNGHNELDDPSITLPLTYGSVDSHPTVLQLYARQLEAEGLTTAAHMQTMHEGVKQHLAQQWQDCKAGKFKQSPDDFLSASWQAEALKQSSNGEDSGLPGQEPTGLPISTIQWVGHALCNVPEEFNMHPHISTLISNRRQMMKSSASRVSFAMAESLAFGTLAIHRGIGSRGVDQQAAEGLNQGAYGIRMSGQDSERGTFNQRHNIIVDQKTGAKLNLLNHIAPPGYQERVDIFNSPLNEAATVGFEYGYSLRSSGKRLVVWEAQFGDFSNNAQVMIDQFICAAEERWGQATALVMMLPHGLEGQGPDHSSARIERFLQLCNDDPDSLPGNNPALRKQISTTFAALAKQHGGYLGKEQALELLSSVGMEGKERHEAADLLWTEMRLSKDAHITEEMWDRLMVQFVRRDAERHSNIFVVNATTPAQLFHVLRRQMNRPFDKPLILFTPKHLLHHRPATSALEDFTSDRYFNRVIDDSKASDNTRHLARNPNTGESYLVEPKDMRRVVLCSGAIYYHLSNARRQRKIRNIALVRLEQLAPFPHDLLIQAICQYKHPEKGFADVVWCQEEPKNQGAFHFVEKRLRCAFNEVLPENQAPPKLRYVGRAAASAPATASVAIHRAELREVVDGALTL